MLDALEEPQPVLGQTVGAGAIALRRDVAQQRAAVGLLALGEVGYT